MMPSRALLPLALAVALAGTAAPARAAKPLEPMPDGLVRVLAPAPGAVLAGGSTVELAWELASGPPPDLEEWEAFLSLDGGRSYPFRLTPHLDLALSRFRVELPGLASREARLLLRFGDERRELELEMPGTFTILPPVSAPPMRFESRGRSGEPARPGLPAVVRWVEGSRSGRGLRQVTAWLPGSFRPAPTFELGRRPVAGFRLDPSAPVVAPPLAALSPGPTHRPPAGTAPQPRSQAGLRLLMCRANE